MSSICVLRKYFFLAILLAAGVFSVQAQTTRVEELLQQLKKVQTDTGRISVMKRLSLAYSSVDPLKKHYYADQYRQLAEKNGIDTLVADGYLDIGIAYGIRGNADSALYYFKLGFEKSKEVNYISGIARSHANIGYAYDRSDRKREAVPHYEEALRIFKKLGIRRSINQNITNLGSLYFDLQQFKMADDYFHQVLESVKETPNDQVGLANALFSLGNSKRKLGNLKQSMAYYEESLLIREKVGDLNGIALSTWGIALVHIERKEYEKAFPFLKRALEINRSVKNRYQETVVMVTYTETYLAMEDYKKAEESAKLALAGANEVNSKALTSHIFSLLVKIKKGQKKFDDALQYQSDFMKLNDSLDHVGTTKGVIMDDLKRVTSENKTLEHDKKTILSKNKDYIMVILIITILLVIVAVLLLLFYKRNQEKKLTNQLLQQQKEEIATINEELLSQMELISHQNQELEKLNKVKNKFFSIVSHDLRSPLITLKTLFGLYRKGDLEETEMKTLLARLENTIATTAAFLDNLLEWSRSQLEGMTVNPALIDISLIVDDNIQLMTIQTQFKSLRVENRIPPGTVLYCDPNMINIVVRNLLSNAIKFCHEGDLVYFDSKTVGANRIFSIRDNGPGIQEKDIANLFNLSNTTSKGSSGEKGYHIGLVLCKEMIIQNHGSIEVESNFGEGTSFHISLPLNAPDKQVKESSDRDSAQSATLDQLQ